MKQIVEMPEVIQCQAKRCSYNIDSMCHARAITVGNMQKHACDTMCTMEEHTHRMGYAGVGACRSTDCIYNEDLECQAEGISVGVSGGHAFCGTYGVR